MQKVPEGSLKTQQKSGKTYYYYQYKDKNTDKCKRDYISQKNMSLAKILAQKGYFIHIKPILSRNLCALQEFMEKYDADSVERIYDELSDGKKSLVTPISISVEEKLKRWNLESYEPYDKNPEMLIFETERGEMVRSKSELIIANMLYKNRKDILYKYERPLEVIIDGRAEKLHPDFTIINIHTGKITFWEHAGRLDDPKYANDFVRKMNTYMNNQIFPGEDLVYTYETLKYPLNISIVKSIVKRML